MLTTTPVRPYRPLAHTPDQHTPTPHTGRPAPTPHTRTPPPIAHKPDEQKPPVRQRRRRTPVRPRRPATRLTNPRHPVRQRRPYAPVRLAPRRYPTPETARRLSTALIAAGLILIPWLLTLTTRLPESAGWITLDTLESLGLITTGLLLRHHSPHQTLAAAATAALLITDAYLDITTAQPPDRPTAIATAILLELPIATLCTTLTHRPPPRHAPTPNYATVRPLTPPSTGL